MTSKVLDFRLVEVARHHPALTNGPADSGSKPVVSPPPNCERAFKASENQELAEVGGNGEADSAAGLSDDRFGRAGPRGDWNGGRGVLAGLGGTGS